MCLRGIDSEAPDTSFYIVQGLRPVWNNLFDKVDVRWIMLNRVEEIVKHNIAPLSCSLAFKITSVGYIHVFCGQLG